MLDKDNKNKNKGGRPPVWATPEELDLDIQHYKLFCKENPEEIPDIESFCYFVQDKRNRAALDRSTLFRYSEKPEFEDKIREIKGFISYKKKQLGLKGIIPAAVFCFDFKNNHDYKDRTEQAVENSGNLVFEVNYKND